MIFIKKENESRLIRGIKNGDKKSADVLIAAYYDEIYIFACRQVGDKQEAMDITQEIFIAAWRALNGFDERKAGFRTWLYRIAVNKIIDYRRKRKTETVSFDEIGEPAFEAAFDKTLYVREIEAYIASLDPEIGRVLRLRIYGGYGFLEIADMLSEPEAKIKSRYYRAVKQVRKEFANYDE